MYVELGNDDAIEGYYDPEDPNQESVLYRSVPGERVTRLVFPEGIGLPEAFATTISTVTRHFARDAVPVWVESDTPALADLISDHYGIKDKKRPADWGQEKAPKKKAAKKTAAKKTAAKKG